MAQGYDWDATDNISGPLKHLFRWHGTLCCHCAVLHCLINHLAIDLWRAFHGLSCIWDRCWRNVRRRACVGTPLAAADDEITLCGCVRHSLVMALWILSALFQACANTEGWFEELRRGISPKRCRSDPDTHLWSEPQRIKGQQRRGEE